MKKLFGLKNTPLISEFISIPDIARKGLVKCRVEYDREIRSVEFVPYTRKPVRSLKLIEDNAIDYSYKYADRSAIIKLSDQKGHYDDILIVKNGLITDTSYSNIVFSDSDGTWVTPESCLLAGTRRAFLLANGSIRTVVLTPADLRNYKSARLINAMIGIDEGEEIGINSIRW